MVLEKELFMKEKVNFFLNKCYAQRQFLVGYSTYIETSQLFVNLFRCLFVTNSIDCGISRQLLGSLLLLAIVFVKWAYCCLMCQG